MTPITPPAIITISGSEIIQLSFYGIIAIYALFTVMLYYHWQTYAADARIEFLTLVTYFIITVPLLLTLSAVALTT